jgi:hypothetical protein
MYLGKEKDVVFSEKIVPGITAKGKNAKSTAVR